MQPAGQKCVFDVSDDAVLVLLLLLTLKIFSLFQPARLHYSGDRWCLFPAGSLQPSAAAEFLTQSAKYALTG